MSDPGFEFLHRPPADLVGRDREYASSLRALWHGHSVLLVGRRGVGASRVAREIAEHLAREGTRRVLAAVTPATRPTIGSAIGLAYDLDDLADAVQNGVDIGTPITVFFDADAALPTATTEWLIRQAATERITLISPLRSAMGSLPVSAIQPRLLTLWQHGRAERVDVAPLARDAADQLVRTVAGRRALDMPTRMRIMRDGAGMPRLLIELTREALDRAESAASAESRLFRPAAAPSPRVLDLVAPLLHGLGPEERNTLVTIARLDGLPAVHVRRYFSGDDVEELVARGLVATERTDRRMYVHRIAAEAAFLQGGGLERAPLDAMLEDQRYGLPPDAQECTYLADHLLETERAERPEGAAAVLAGAGAIALASGAPDRALAYAREAVGSGPPGAEALAARAVQAMRGHAPAPELFPSVPDAVQEMRWVDVVTDTEEALETERDSHRRLALLGPLELAATILGREGLLLESLRMGRALVPHVLASTDPVRLSEGSAVVAQYVSYAAFSKVLSGIGWGELQSNLELTALWVLSKNFGSHLPVLGAPAGLLAYARGDFARAEAEIRAALDADHPGWAPFSRTWLITTAGRAALHQGKIDDARIWVALSRAESAEFSSWDEYALQQAEADLALAGGESRRAADMLLEQARVCSEHSPLLAVVMAYEAVRAGAEGEEPRALLETNSLLVEFEAVRSMAGAAFGRLNRDTRAVTRELRATQSRGHLLLAGQIAGQSADPSSRRTPAEGDPAADSLTPREREIAVLAGAGTSNADIATALYLSVRTVESHLYSARLKTGARSRQELSEVARAAWDDDGTGQGASV